MTRVFVGVVSLLLTAVVSDAARVLVLSLYRGKSHWIVIEPLLLELASRGHQVIAFSVFPQKHPVANYTDVDFSSLGPPLVGAVDPEMIKKRLSNPWVTQAFVAELCLESCEFMKEQPFKELLRSKDKFDVVITELFATDCFTYFAYKLKIPLISFTSMVPQPWSSERMGLPDNPSYIPSYPLSYDPKMTLWEKVYNSFVLLSTKLLDSNVYAKQAQRTTEQILGEPLPPVHEVVANTSLLLVNSYHALTYSRPLPPNVIEVGGIHMKDTQPLPKYLQEVFDRASHGVIILSFGSLVKASTLPKPFINMFIRAFARVPQTVVFKYEEELPEAPSNVVLMDWLPQRDMLEHKNVVAVILHGGLSSTIEAVHCAKPMIGIPFFADQTTNIMAVVRKGAGILLDMDSLTEGKILAAIAEITTNPKYTENMKKLSHQYRDRPMTPLQSAVFWTEYVIRHKGAPHLRPASVGMPLYQYLLLDVIAVVLTALALLLTAVYVILKNILKNLSKKQLFVQGINNDVKKVN